MPRGAASLLALAVAVAVLAPQVQLQALADDPQEYTDLLAYLDEADGNYTSFSAALQASSAITDFLKQTLADGNSLTIFAPFNDALDALAERLGSGKAAKYCKAVNAEVNGLTVTSTLALHIVTGYFTNEDLIALDFLTPLPNLTPAQFYALPQYYSSEVGSIQVGTAAPGLREEPISWASVNEVNAYNTTAIIVHGLDGVVNYPGWIYAR